MSGPNKERVIGIEDRRPQQYTITYCLQVAKQLVGGLGAVEIPLGNHHTGVVRRFGIEGDVITQFLVIDNCRIQNTNRRSYKTVVLDGEDGESIIYRAGTGIGDPVLFIDPSRREFLRAAEPEDFQEIAKLEEAVTTEGEVRGVLDYFMGPSHFVLPLLT